MARRLACSALAAEMLATRPATAPAASSRAKRVAGPNFKVITVLMQAGGSPWLIWASTLSADDVAPQGQLRHTGRHYAAAVAGLACKNLRLHGFLVRARHAIAGSRPRSPNRSLGRAGSSPCRLPASSPCGRRI